MALGRHSGDVPSTALQRPFKDASMALDGRFVDTTSTARPGAILAGG